ncbi:hypothetical protein C2134_08485 [Chromobacterium sinusclupearum]|uniref:Uncharacterized protein n=1 Tax=Chromobacterium sinusclupearum TaxID=2077146 RepID=A0A2K4MQP1_9NEIS|nr:hypothetical protein C2134_08485 [Chromobacterium sinusclupearum]
MPADCFITRARPSCVGCAFRLNYWLFLCYKASFYRFWEFNHGASLQSHRQASDDREQRFPRQQQD